MADTDEVLAQARELAIRCQKQGERIKDALKAGRRMDDEGRAPAFADEIDRLMHSNDRPTGLRDGVELRDYQRYGG